MIQIHLSFSKCCLYMLCEILNACAEHHFSCVFEADVKCA